MKFYIFRTLGLIFVSFLTILSGCALFQFDPDSQETDPVARAALGYRSPSTSLPELPEEELVLDSLDDHELSVGMRMRDVLSRWGHPREVETAGDPRFGNQKWTYWEGISNRYQLLPTRVVYFEAGKVAGWETKK